MTFDLKTSSGRETSRQAACVDRILSGTWRITAASRLRRDSISPTQRRP